MPDFIPKQAPCPFVSPEIYIALVVVVAPVALVFRFVRNLHRPLLEQLPDGVPAQIPAIPEDLDGPTVRSATTPPQAETEGTGSTPASDEASRAEIAPTFVNATIDIDRSAEIAGILNKILNASRGILLDIHRCDERTMHPANGILIQSMQIFYGNTEGAGAYTVEPYSVMFDCWISKLEEYAEWIGHREKGRRYIFLLNNTYDVWQTMRCPRPPFSNLELTGRLTSMVQQYKKHYFDECWVPLNNPCHLDKFTSVFYTICKDQMTWKVTAELRKEETKEAYC
uniref:Uncharacterized protein n=1 Tax=Avena sativa TaxID=4498 RepID=A0ACD5YCS9_AVESA